MKKWIIENAHNYQRKGGKIHRRNRVRTLVRALEDTRQHENGVAFPHQVGRRHIHAFYARHSNLSLRTLEDYRYGFELLWRMLDRAGAPPKPPLPSPSVIEPLRRSGGTSNTRLTFEAKSPMIPGQSELRLR